MFTYSNSSTFRKLGALVLASLTSLAVLMATSAVGLRNALHDERRLQTRSLVEVAVGIVEHFHALAARGELSEERAKAAAIAALRELRYAESGYFWISDTRGVVVMHPYRPELDGAVPAAVDASERQLFREMAAVVAQQRHGFVEYFWPKPRSTVPVRKVSYVQGFTPWGWIIGSGVFVDDVDTLFRAQAGRFFAVLIAIALVNAFVAWRIVRSILRPLGAEPALVAEMANRVADGELDVPLEIDRADRASVVHAMTRMVKRLRRDVQMAEEELARAARLDGIGRLAGGIAHDFNNLLVVVLGCVNALRNGLGPDHPLYQEVVELGDASQRAATLTRQLLAFGRRDVVRPETLDLNATVSDASRVLRRLVGEDIELAVNLAPEQLFVVVDPAKLQQVILNLVVNARDAMPRGGKLSIQTGHSVVASEHPVLPPGRYAVLAICDTGCGMSTEVQRHLFEPFFTTKREGRGTGLGLATVFGVVKQAGGHIEVESAPGAGACFRVYVPRAERRTSAAGLPTPLPTHAPGGETILVVEDEAAVLKRTAQVLERAGYRVVAAHGPEEAEMLQARAPGAFDLLLSDVIMPRTSGPQLAERLLKKAPDMRVLFMSGYTDEHVSRYGSTWADVPVVDKPFEDATLLAAVAEALARPAPPPGASG